MALLSLQEVYSLSILMYAAPALHLSVMQTNELNLCWNMVFRRIFQYNKWESVRAVIDGWGRLDVRNLILLRKIQFYRRIFYRNDCVLHELFCALMLSDIRMHDISFYMWRSQKCLYTISSYWLMWSTNLFNDFVLFLIIFSFFGVFSFIV